MAKQLSEIEKQTAVLDNLQKLPIVCAAYHMTNKGPILLRRGVDGYSEASLDFDVVGFNKSRGITAKQVEAMLVGSAFGWYVPGADADRVDGKITKDCV